MNEYIKYLEEHVSRWDLERMVRKHKEEQLKYLCWEATGDSMSDAVFNALCRGGVQSIDDLKSADLDTIRKFRSIGERRLEFVKKMKDIIEERGL